MLRTELKDALKEAMLEKDNRTVATLRLILAAIKDRDIAARGKAEDGGDDSGVNDDEVLALLGTMVKQRNESIRMYEEGGRLELAEQEREEINIIKRFMPEQLDGDAMAEAVQSVISEVGAENLKDMGKTMGLLKERYAGKMDFAAASKIVREQLA